MKNKKKIPGWQALRLMAAFILGVFLITFIAVGQGAAYEKMTFGEWLNEWQATKAEFEVMTKKKKPSKKFMKIFRKSSGIEKKLKTLDETYLSAKYAAGEIGTLHREGKKINKALKKKFNKALKNYTNAIKAFKKQKNKYIKQLDEALKKENNPDSAYAKGLKILKADLKAIYSTAKGQLTYLQAIEKGKAAKEAVRDKAFLLKALKGAIKKGKLFCKRVKAKKTVNEQITEFNKGNLEAARDITQNLGNLLKQMDESDKHKKEGETILDVLKQWGNKGRKLKEDASEDSVKAELKFFCTTLKQASKWYKKIKTK